VEWQSIGQNGDSDGHIRRRDFLSGLLSVRLSDAEHVRSPAAAWMLRSFLDSLNDTGSKFVNDNVLHFSQLCSEFGFKFLSSKISDFVQISRAPDLALKSSILAQARTGSSADRRSG
jgi:hypothetical protein